MRASLCIGILAATLASGAATATELVVGKSRLVIDVEFWGRAQINSPNPDGSNDDIITYGDPVHGKFRIFPGDAPSPQAYSGPSPPATSYGDIHASPPPTGAAFVTSRWLSPFPKSPLPITHQVSQSAGTVPDDYVVLGDRVRFAASEPRKDYFQVSDQFSPTSADDTISGESLTISMTSTLDFIQGTALDQAFELDDLLETDDTSTYGFFRAKVGDGAVAFFDFVVDRIRVTPRVCKP